MNSQQLRSIFDGVIADYDGWKDERIFGLPRADDFPSLITQHLQDLDNVVYSSRATADIRPYLIENSVPFDEIN
jgi:hypothetical protein